MKTKKTFKVRDMVVIQPGIEQACRGSQAGWNTAMTEAALCSRPRMILCEPYKGYSDRDQNQYVQVDVSDLLSKGIGYVSTYIVPVSHIVHVVKRTKSTGLREDQVNEGSIVRMRQVKNFRTCSQENCAFCGEFSGRVVKVVSKIAVEPTANYGYNYTYGVQLLPIPDETLYSMYIEDFDPSYGVKSPK